VAVALDEPLTIVAILESEERLTQGFDGLELLDPEELLFEGADEALGAPVALRLADEGRAARDPQEAQLGLEVVAHELATVVVAERQTGGDALAVPVEVLADTLAERLEGLEAGALAGGMDADALGGELVDRDEDRRSTLGGPGGGGVDPPHRIRAVRDDRAVVRGGAVRLARPRRGQEVRLTHESEHARLAGPDPGQAQACPDLPVALADERRPRQDRTDLVGQLGVRPCRLRPALPRHDRPLPPAASRVDGRARDLQHATHPSQAVATLHGGRGGPPHHLDLRRPKGPPSPSARRARSRSSSTSIVSSPIFARSRPSSSSRSSAGRLFTAA